MKQPSEFFKPLILLAVLVFGFTLDAPAQSVVTIEVNRQPPGSQTSGGILPPTQPIPAEVILPATGTLPQLINIDLGGAGGRGYSLKTGFAAVGQTTSDFWNFYDRDISPTPYDWRSSETLVNVKAASGAPTTVGVSISDAPGAWGDASSDPMYATYDYPLDGGNNVVTFTNLPAGQYDVLAYSVDGNYEVTVGGTSYGVKTTYDSPVSTVPVWTEGVQYAHWRNVTVAAGQPLVLTVRNGVGGWAILSGVQILSDTPVTPDCTPAPTGLVGWWPAEGNGNDSAGANNAVVPAGVTYVPAEVGEGFSLDGQAHQIVVPDAPELNFKNNQDFSLEVWIQPLANPQNWQDVMSIIDKRIAPDTITQLGYELNLEAGVVTFQMADTLAPFSWHNFSGGPDLRDGKFHHVAVTVQRNSTTGGRLYIDGQLVLTFDPTVCPGDLSNTGPLRIGNHATPGLQAYYHGIIDEVSLYNRALSDSEITAIYNASSAGKCVPVYPPTITTQPTNQLVTVGDNVAFSVTASGSTPLNYQWSFNGTNINNANNNMLTLSNVQLGQAGNYSVQVSNSVGSTNSVAATLKVNQLPVADASATVLPVISVNNSNATVVLNGSLSYDLDGDPLQYAWYQTGSPNPLATGVIAVVVLPVGTNSITLVVNDGLASSQQTIAVAVITLAQAVDQLEAVVNAADISHKQSLLASLNAALGAIDRSNPTAAINQLQAFQNKVTAQISPLDPALAQTLIDQAQSIINTLSGGGGAAHKAMKASAQAHGKIHLNFSGTHQQVYIIEASTNLVDWQMIGVANDQGDGTFNFDDADAAHIPQRYYRVVAP